MNDEALLQRISCTPGVMVGKPVIAGTRLTVEYILGVLAHGMTFDDLLSEHPGLTVDDIRACLLFASCSLADTDFVPLRTEPA